MTITLDTPEQINAWILLSRVHQAELHMKGYSVKGLLKWLQANIPDCANDRTVKDAYPHLLDYAGEFGGVLDNHKELCNYQLLVAKMGHNLYFDFGIFDSIDDIQSIPNMQRAYDAGRVIILRTMKDVRGPDRKVMMEVNE